VVQRVSTHEPTVARAPGGEFVMHFLAFHWNARNASMCACADGNTRRGDCPDGVGQAEAARRNGGTWMSWAASADGPWSEPVLIFQPGQWGEPWPIGTNLATAILPNRSVVGMIKSSGGPQGSTIHLVTATDWQRPETYTARFDGAHVTAASDASALFPPDPSRNVTQFGLEDQFVYRDAAGRFHALFHQQIEYDDERICGGHAFSADGISWTCLKLPNWSTCVSAQCATPRLTPTPQRAAACFRYGGTAFSNHVAFDDGADTTFRRRERPVTRLEPHGRTSCCCLLARWKLLAIPFVPPPSPAHARQAALDLRARRRALSADAPRDGRAVRRRLVRRAGPVVR
jgi:hypothetical protein